MASCQNNVLLHPLTSQLQEEKKTGDVYVAPTLRGG